MSPRVVRRRCEKARVRRNAPARRLRDGWRLDVRRRRRRLGRFDRLRLRAHRPANGPTRLPRLVRQTLIGLVRSVSRPIGSSRRLRVDDLWHGALPCLTSFPRVNVFDDATAAPGIGTRALRIALPMRTRHGRLVEAAGFAPASGCAYRSASTCIVPIRSGQASSTCTAFTAAALRRPMPYPRQTGRTSRRSGPSMTNR